MSSRYYTGLSVKARPSPKLSVAQRTSLPEDTQHTLWQQTKRLKLHLRVGVR